MLEIFDCAQGSPDWYRVRAGLPTASCFSTVQASGKGGGESLTRKTYMRKLAGEIITGEPMDSYSNANMERGQIMEAEARDYYAFVTDAEPQLIGFIRNGPKGCSPDALIGDKGALEIKTAQPNVLIDALLRDDAPPEHKAQCQGVLWVAEREWLDLVVYWPKMPTVIHRVHRDEAYISALAEAVGTFNDELAALVARVQAYTPARAAA